MGEKEVIKEEKRVEGHCPKSCATPVLDSSYSPLHALPNCHPLSSTRSSVCKTGLHLSWQKQSS